MLNNITADEQNCIGPKSKFDNRNETIVNAGRNGTGFFHIKSIIFKQSEVLEHVINTMQSLII